MRIQSRVLIGALGSLAAFTWLATANDVSAGQRWWRRVQFLADDRRAAEYVAAEFHKYGLAPAGTEAISNQLSLTCRE
jgi:hypothetical protein